MMNKDENLAVQGLLMQRKSERNALLQKVRQQLEADPRVVAAWLFGSLGRGNPDALSDIDLFVVTTDADYAALAGDRHAFVAQASEPLLRMEAPQNSPPGGAYLMALYPGENGPHTIDWYWQAASRAAIPADTQVLFDRIGLSRLDTSTHFDFQPVPERDPLETVAQTVNFFWVMLLITAKYVARSPEEPEMGLLRYVETPLRDIFAFLGLPHELEASLIRPHAAPEQKLTILRTLAAQMETLMPQVRARGVQTPDAIVPAAHRYLALIETLTSWKEWRIS